MALVATVRDAGRAQPSLDAPGSSLRKAGRYACRADGEIRHPRRRAALGRADRRRQQERGPADPRRLPSDRGGAAAAPGAADPRYRGPDRTARAARGRGRLGRRQQRPALRPRRHRRRPSTRSSRARSAPRSCSPGRCWPASAKRGCRRPAATSSAAAASTPTSTPSRTSAPRVAGDRWIELTAPGGLCACEIFMDEPSVMGTENALMAAALTPGATHDLQRRLRAPRPGPGAPADQDGRPGRRDRLQRDDRQRPPTSSAAPSTRSRPTTSRSAASWRSPRRPGASCGSATSSRPT